MRRDSGFSLVELMCAILILGLGVTSLTRGISQALKASKESEIQTAAALVAAGQIETLRAEGFIEDGEREDDCGDALPHCRWRQSIRGTSVAGLHEITIEVEHKTSGQSLFELKTLLFDAPVDNSQAETETRPRSSRDRRRGGRQ